ncbi:MAG: hypothetical protein EAZ42_01040 [Verrucomicrobia bacterium]|nr:MAG: hypothetical protein EAZ42_01040 [Verrucomicrobiota bacterium]
MTMHLGKSAFLISMHHYICLLIVSLLFLPLTAAPAEEPALRELLRDALYTEEVARDSEAAAKQYEQVLSRYSEQRAFAASALFRLAEVRRKQDRKDDAIQLYQRLLAEFPNAETETKLARENLASLGGKLPETKAQDPDTESVELARLESLTEAAPDIILDPETLEEAAAQGHSKVVAYLLAAGSRPFAGGALSIAVEKGYLDIVRQLTSGDEPVPTELAAESIDTAVKFNRYNILESLLQQGLKPGQNSVNESSTLTSALLSGSQQSVEILLKHGADLDAIASGPDAFEAQPKGTALQWVIAEGEFDAANWLLDKGAKPDIPSRGFGITPLHEAVVKSSQESLTLMQRLLEAGADPNRRTADVMDTKRGALFQNITPLMLAVQTKESTEKMRLLLKHGADAKSERQLIPLFFSSSDWETKLDCFQLLIDAGARPDDAWMRERIAENSAPDFIYEKLIIPGFANDAEVQLVIKDPFGIRQARIAVRTDETAPPDLRAWLLANHQNSQWADDGGGSMNYPK